MKRTQALATAMLFLPVATVAMSMSHGAHKTILAATDPAALMRQGDALAAAAQYDQAADSYSAAAQAYEAAGQTSKSVDAYKKAAAMSEKAADAALNGGGGATPAPAPPPKVKPAPAKRPVAAPVHKSTPIAPIAARSGHIVGRAVTIDGAPIPSFTILYSGFEDGKLAATYADGSLAETINTSAQGQNGRYSIKVPPGAYRVSGYVTYHYHGNIYNFDMYLENEPAHHDYSGLGLDKLGRGLVRNFRLSMTGKKPGADEGYEEGYYDAYTGGLIKIDPEEVEYTIGGPNPPNLVAEYPADSKIEMTLVPQGPLVDRTTGSTVVQSIRLGDYGKWFSCLRAIPVGQYSATARLVTPDGESIPLRLATKRGDMIKNGDRDSYVMHWQNSLSITFEPNDLGPQPCFGAKRIRPWVGK